MPRVCGESGESLTEIAAGEPFGIEVDLSLIGWPSRPVLSWESSTQPELLCKLDVSGEDCLSEQNRCDRHLLSVWYPENHLSTGAYEFTLTIRGTGSSESFEKTARILSFALVGTGAPRGKYLPGNASGS